jgi:hypothetical protein
MSFFSPGFNETEELTTCAWYSSTAACAGAGAPWMNKLARTKKDPVSQAQALTLDRIFWMTSDFSVPRCILGQTVLKSGIGFRITFILIYIDFLLIRYFPYV